LKEKKYFDLSHKIGKFSKRRMLILVAFVSNFCANAKEKNILFL